MKVIREGYSSSWTQMCISRLNVYSSSTSTALDSIIKYVS